MSDREQSCEERIADHLAGRLGDFRGFRTRDEEAYEREAWDEIEETMIERDEYPLAVSVYRTVCVDLSTGGPADWFEVRIDSDGEPGQITYHFADWFDHASRILEGPEYDEALTFLAPFVEIASYQ